MTNHCSVPAGRHRLAYSNAAASIPTGRRTNGRDSANTRSTAGAKRSGRTGDPEHLVADRLERGVQRHVGSVHVLPRRRELEDVGLERADDEHRDAEPERRHLHRERFGPAFERSLAGRVRRWWWAFPGSRPRSTRRRSGRAASLRIAGSSRFVRRIGPKRLVVNMSSTTSTGISSTAPAPATPALWTIPSGAPTRSRISDDGVRRSTAGSSRSRATPIRRSSSNDAPSRSVSRFIPTSGARIAARTVQPFRKRCTSGRQAQATRRARDHDAARPIRDRPSLVPRGSECDGARAMIVDTFLTAPGAEPRRRRFRVSYESTANPIKVGYLMDFVLPGGVPAGPAPRSHAVARAHLRTRLPRTA